jgi:hypothetical protein
MRPFARIASVRRVAQRADDADLRADAAQYLRMNALIWLKARGQWERLDRFGRDSNLPVLCWPRPAVSRGDAERRAFFAPQR